MKHDVFISYSSKNGNAANAICHTLEERGIKCWMAPRDIPPGSEYGDLIDKAINATKVVVVVFSQYAAESQWVKGELNIAFEEQKIIIPYRIDSTPFCGQNRVILNQRHWIDSFPDYRTKFQDLANAVISALGKPVGYENSKTDMNPNNGETVVRKNKSLILTSILIGIIVVAATVVMCFFGGVHQGTSFSYSNNGLNITNIRNLSDMQKEALLSILDNLVLVTGGDFEMGNNSCYPEYMTEWDSLSSNTHTVSLSSFYISRYEVTQKQWKAFVRLAGCYLELDDNKAIDNISWEEANQFADTLSVITGLKFSLPTEAQWEYAAGDGNIGTRFPFAGFEDGIRHYAWTIADNLNSAQPVGGKSPNRIGLYDMTGNVSEWCLDDFAKYLTTNVVDPVIILDNNKKIFRGGDYRTPNILDMKISTRYYAPSFTKREGCGMRLVINL